MLGVVVRESWRTANAPDDTSARYKTRSFWAVKYKLALGNADGSRFMEILHRVKIYGGRRWLVFERTHVIRSSVYVTLLARFP